MKCPRCHGRGTISRRFLFIRWESPCPRCGVRSDDDFPTRSDDSYSSSAVAGASPSRDEGFEVGGGGRSGGAGGGASWGDEAPVIVDPFAAESATAGDAAVTDAGWSADSDSTSSDSGTAY
jgi:hypothetical protein